MFSKFLFYKLLSWKENGPFPDFDKCVVIIAPHTSNLDLFVGRLYYKTIKRKPKFIIKKEMFFFPLGIILRALGGIPVDRNKGVGIIDQVVEKINNSEKFTLNVTPEGTRKKVKKWKKGFYQIALKANVPIAIGYIDYKKKEIGIMNVLYPTGDYNSDIKFIRKHYKGISGKKPQNFYIEEDE